MNLMYDYYWRTSDKPIVIIGSLLHYGNITSMYLYYKLQQLKYPNIVLYVMKNDSISEGYNAANLVRSSLFIGILYFI